MKTFSIWSIFMLVAGLSLSARGLYASMAQQEIPANAIVINLDGNGDIRLQQEPVEFSVLPDRIREASKTAGDGTAVIVTAPAANFKDVVRIVEVARTAGIERVGIVKSPAGGAARVSTVPPNATVLSIDRTGTIRLNRKKLKLNSVSSQLQRVFRRRSEHTVFIQAYGSLSFDIVADVIDAAKAAGAAPIGLLTSSD